MLHAAGFPIGNSRHGRGVPRLYGILRVLRVPGNPDPLTRSSIISSQALTSSLFGSPLPLLTMQMVGGGVLL